MGAVLPPGRAVPAEVGQEVWRCTNCGGTARAEPSAGYASGDDGAEWGVGGQGHRYSGQSFLKTGRQKGTPRGKRRPQLQERGACTAWRRTFLGVVQLGLLLVVPAERALVLPVRLHPELPPKASRVVCMTTEHGHMSQQQEGQGGRPFQHSEREPPPDRPPAPPGLWPPGSPYRRPPGDPRKQPNLQRDRSPAPGVPAGQPV